MSVPEQLVSATEQLRKCSRAVTKVFRSSYECVLEQSRKCSRAVSKSSGAVNKFFGTLISLPHQL